MPRQRLGAVLMVPQPVATEIDGLRRALADPVRGRVAPHLTLVPPVNVHDRDLPAALDVVRRAAASVGPLRLRLGPVATFHPADPVLYLVVSGDLDGYDALRRALLTPPLERAVHDPWVPHVTVAANVEPQRIPAAVEALSDFDADVTLDKVHLLTEQPDRVWRPIADAPLGHRGGTVGRGGIELTLHTSGRPDPEAASLLALEAGHRALPFAVTARRDGEVVGAAWGWTNGVRLEIADLAVAAAHRDLGIARKLLAAVEALGRRRGCTVAGIAAPAEGPAPAVLAGAGWTVAAPGDDAATRRWSRVL